MRYERESGRRRRHAKESRKLPMAISDLIQFVMSYTGLSETEAVLTTAYEIAERVHHGFLRLSGDTAISHHLAVA